MLAALLQTWRQQTPYSKDSDFLFPSCKLHGKQLRLRQSHVDMAMHYVHDSRKARNAQAEFIERFLPNGGAVAEVEEQSDDEPEPVRIVRMQ